MILGYARVRLTKNEKIYDVIGLYAAVITKEDTSGSYKHIPLVL